MTLHSPYALYVFVAYGISAVLVLAIIWQSWRQWRQASRDWCEVQSTTAQTESEAP